MALTEIVLLDIQNAQRTIDRLEQQLAQLGQPIDVPVDISGEQELAQIRRELDQSDDAAERLNRELSETDAELRQAGTQARRTGDDIESAGRRGGTAFGSLRSSVIGLVGAFGAIQGARAFLDFAGDSIDAASDLEESTSKAQVVFGSFFDDIQAFSQTAPQALGLANAQALEFAGTFGNLFVALGLSQQAAADLSPDIVQLGADLASFNNIEVTDALDKLRAGLVGEAEPLRVLGVNLTAASTAAKAVELGLAASTTEVSEAAKVQARYAQILERTATAQGDFERTSEGIANRQRTLTGEFENFRAKVGESLLPVFETLLDTGKDVLPLLEGMIPAFGFLGEVVDDVTDHLSAAGDLLGILVDPIVDILDAAGADVDTDAFSELSESARDLIDPLNEDLQLLERFKLFWDTGLSRSTFLGIFEEFNAELERGDDAIGAAGRAFASFIEEGELTADIIRAIGESAGLTSADLIHLFGSVAAGDFGPLGPQELEEVLALIAQLRLETSREFPPLSDFFGGAGEAAAGAAPEIDAFAESIRQVEVPDFSAEISALEQQFSKLPDGLDAAAEALRDSENEIRTDFTGFLDELESELARGAEFRAGIIELEDLGLDEVADAFRNLGPESLELLRDALANPTEAIVANDLLAEDAAAVAQDFRDQLAADILEAGPLDLTLPVNLTAVINALDIEGLPNGAAQGNQIREGARLQNVNDITINLESSGDTTTDAARAAQQINAIVNVE